MTTRKWLLFLLAGAALLPVSCAPSNSITIQGCGATFPAPLYKRWFLEFYKMNPTVRVNYQAIGSGAGIRQLEEDLVDFAATDEPKKVADLKKIAESLAKRENVAQIDLLQAPLTAGSVALCYNLPGNPHLKLTRAAYLGILLGDITMWNDPAIQSSNPDLTLPSLRITFIRRAESSGTTFVFTSHLSAVDDRWKSGKGLGASKSIQWPVGIGGKGNSGVAALIQQTPGAFGYLEAGYAELLGLHAAALQNDYGNFIGPSEEASQAALEEAKDSAEFGTKLPPTNPRAANAYPIVTFTWIVCRKHYSDPRIAASLKALFIYCLESGAPGRGQDLSKDLHYVPLPPESLAEARKKIQEIEVRQ